MTSCIVLVLQRHSKHDTDESTVEKTYQSSYPTEKQYTELYQTAIHA